MRAVTENTNFFVGDIKIKTLLKNKNTKKHFWSQTKQVSLTVKDLLISLEFVACSCVQGAECSVQQEAAVFNSHSWKAMFKILEKSETIFSQKISSAPQWPETLHSPHYKRLFLWNSVQKPPGIN